MKTSGFVGVAKGNNCSAVHDRIFIFVNIESNSVCVCVCVGGGGDLLWNIGL